MIHVHNFLQTFSLCEINEIFTKLLNSFTKRKIIEIYIFNKLWFMTSNQSHEDEAIARMEDHNCQDLKMNELIHLICTINYIENKL